MAKRPVMKDAETKADREPFAVLRPQPLTPQQEQSDNCQRDA
jgi:hypothetical protein